LREQTKQAKRRAKDEKKALRKADKLSDAVSMPDVGAIRDTAAAPDAET
jgi:hypothetical protein